LQSLRTANRRWKARLPLRADAHRHQDVEEWCLDLQDAGTHLVDEIEENFILGQGAEWGHEKLRIERDREIPAFVSNGERFLRFADFRGVRRDIDVVLREIEFDRV